LYKKDKGEAFKRINQAYQYLKKYQDPPKIQTVYQQKESYSSRSKDYKNFTERAKRTANNSARQAEKEKQRQAYYSKLFTTLNPYVLMILVLNCVLALDYFLPRVQETSTINSTKKIYNGWKIAEKGILEIRFESGEKIYLYNGKEFSPSALNNHYTYEKTAITRQQISLYDENRKLKLKVGFNVLKVFSFIIIIQLIAIWRYFAVKDPHVKLSAIVVMGFFIFMQLVLIFIR
jgi:hypothetical protein